MNLLIKQTFAFDKDRYSRLQDGRLQQPRQAESYENLENIRTEGVTHGHITESLPDHKKRRNNVRQRNTDRQKR